MTDETIISKAMSSLAKRRHAKMTPEERRAYSKKMHEAKKKKKLSTPSLD